jgi:hypothetical protein
VGQLADRIGRNAGLTLGVLEGVRLDLGLVGVEAARRPIDELAVLQTRRDDLPSDRVGEGDVAADVDAEPDVGPLGRARPPRIDGEQPRPVIDAAEEVVEEDRMRLAGVRAPQDDEVCLLGLSV